MQMFCVKKVWLIIDNQRGMFVWLNSLTQEAETILGNGEGMFHLT